MATANLDSRALVQQGYDYTPEQLRELRWGLRFTPFVCMLGAAYGLATQNATLHFVMAALGIVPFWFPAWHPVDRFYNHIISPMWGGMKLPPNPLQRRIACVIGGSMNLVVGIAFSIGQPTVAYVFGFILVPLQIVVISTHVCVASWIIEAGMRLTGSWSAPMDVSDAMKLVEGGACLVDVRDPDEFANGHLPNAVNIPVHSIGERSAEFMGKPVVLYCASGLRSQTAWKQLKSLGADVHNLGSFDRYYE